MDFNAFSHGQIQSKIWLCENLENYMPDDTKIAILGSWYNMLGFMLLIRNQHKYKLINGIDINSESIDLANKIVHTWEIGTDYKIKNICEDANTFNLESFDVIINTSVEHMVTNWYNNVTNQLICIQSSNVVTDDPLWDIKTPSNSLEDLKNKFPMSQILFEGEKVFDYGHLQYKRFMLIGKK